MPLVGRATIPTDSFGIVLRDTGSVVIHPTESELRFPMSLLGRESIPAHRFTGVLSDTGSDLVSETNVVLRAGMALLSGQPIPAHGCSLILWHTSAGHIEPSEIELCRRVASLGQRTELLGAPLSLHSNRDHHHVQRDSRDTSRPATPVRQILGHRVRALVIGTASARPTPSSSVIAWFASTSVILSTCPLGQTTRIELTDVDGPSPKVKGSSL